MDMERVFEQIAQERERQVAKWGKQHHPLAIWMLILQEEIGEVAKGILEEDDPVAIRTELIQAAAVITACLEDEISFR